MNETQKQYLTTLAESGSAVKAQRAAGVGRRALSNWRRDEDFAEAEAAALDAANDALLQRAREVAMQGDTRLLSTWMRALIPALRPANSVNVAVGVNQQAALISDEDAQVTATKLNDLLAQLQARVEPRPLPAVDPGPIEDAVDPDAIC